MSTNRIDAYKTVPEAMQALMAVEEHLKKSGLERSLVELVKMRASQINGCAFCLDLHSRDARNNGETEKRLYLLSAWRESSLYSEREQAALAWTESLTLISQNHAPDTVYERVREHFNDQELVNLTLLITQINAWNRFAIGFRYEHP